MEACYRRRRLFEIRRGRLFDNPVSRVGVYSMVGAYSSGCLIEALSQSQQ